MSDQVVEETKIAPEDVQNLVKEAQEVVAPKKAKRTSKPKAPVLEKKVFTRTKTEFTFTKTITVTLEVMDPEEVQEILGTWEKEKEALGLTKFATRHQGKILLVWGEPGARKAQIQFQDGSIHKVWYYTKWGWSEA